MKYWRKLKRKINLYQPSNLMVGIFLIKFMEKRRIYIIREIEIGETIWGIQKR